MSDSSDTPGANSAAHPGQSECPDENDLCDYVEGRSLALDRVRIEEHIDQCPMCRKTLSEFARGPRSQPSEQAHEESSTAALEGEADFLSQGDRLSRYLIIECIGVGAIGVVYTAYDPKLDRRVALKLLRSAKPRSEPKAAAARARFEREARALARLAHPNVVAVHDVGTSGNDLFIAMELVSGETLTSWLTREKRTRKGILDVFIQAGRGLAAAHAAGLVHRDFKPENVLVGNDGRVRVTDFGLARLESSEEGGRDVDDGFSAQSRAHPILTQTGTVLGTPAYMAPEQHRGLAASAKSDQFSFCVALYEALEGDRPFPGDTQAALAEAAGSSRLRPPRFIPAWLQAVLAQGLSADPEKRYPSLNDLLSALQRGANRGRRRLQVLAAAALLVPAVLLGYALRYRSGPCGDAKSKLVGIWDEPKRREIRAKFEATRVPYAPDAWRAVATAFDSFAAQWVAMHQETCEATWNRGNQSQEVLARRTLCLETRLGEFHALVKVFESVSPQVVENATKAAQRVRDLAKCADTKALLASAPLAEESIRPQVKELSEALSQAKALRDSGLFTQALTALEHCVAEARSLGYAPVTAEALHELGMALDALGRADEAEAAEYEAVEVAVSTGQDAIAASGYANLVRLVGGAGRRFDEAVVLKRLANATVARLGGDAGLSSLIANNFGIVLSVHSRFHEALSEYRRGLELAEQEYGKDSLAGTALMLNLAKELGRVGTPAEAFSLAERAVSIRSRLLGDSHPRVAEALEGLATLCLRADRYDEAVSCLSRAVAIRKQSSGPSGKLLAMPLANLAHAFWCEGRLDEALSAADGAIAAAQLPSPDVPKIAGASITLAVVRHELGRDAQALERLHEVEKLLATTTELKRTDVLFAGIASARGLILGAQGRHRDGLRLDEQAVAMLEHEFGPEHPDLVEPLTQAAREHWKLGDSATAVQLLDRALVLSPGSLAGARARFLLAQILWVDTSERPRARDAAVEARDTFARLGKWWEKERAKVAEWLAERD